ncbi:MAG: HlyD family efflux transporter periplasmic adaptor subunit [Acidobacteriota bacterium]
MRAGTAGVVQVVPVEVGEQVAPGTKMARVAEPGKLRAELRINETQAKDISIGQLVSIDTRNGIVPGRVSRIDPSSQNSTVTVDVRLEGPLPQGARPDLTIDGTIELERLDNIIYVGRPAFGQENSTITFQARPRWDRSLQRAGQAGTHFSQCDRDPGGTAAGRPGHSFGYVGFRWGRSCPIELI